MNSTNANTSVNANTSANLNVTNFQQVRMFDRRVVDR